MSLIENNDRLLQEKDDNSIKQLIDDAGYDIDFEDYLAYEHDPSKGDGKLLTF